MPKGSRTVHRLPNGKLINREASKRYAPWAKAAVAALREQHDGPPFEPPYRVALTFKVGPRPAKPSWGHPSVGDLDKLVRSCMDVMGGSKAGVPILLDDRHCVELAARKAWCEPGEEPHTAVHIESLV